MRSRLFTPDADSCSMALDEDMASPLLSLSRRARASPRSLRSAISPLPDARAAAPHHALSSTRLSKNKVETRKHRLVRSCGKHGEGTASSASCSRGESSSPLTSPITPPYQRSALSKRPSGSIIALEDEEEAASGTESEGGSQAASSDSDESEGEQLYRQAIADYTRSKPAISPAPMALAQPPASHHNVLTTSPMADVLYRMRSNAYGSISLTAPQLGLGMSIRPFWLFARLTFSAQ